MALHYVAATILIMSYPEHQQAVMVRRARVWSAALTGRPTLMRNNVAHVSEYGKTGHIYLGEGT